MHGSDLSDGGVVEAGTEIGAAVRQIPRSRPWFSSDRCGRDAPDCLPCVTAAKNPDAHGRDEARRGTPRSSRQVLAHRGEPAPTR